jgi:hypothetical protein
MRQGNTLRVVFSDPQISMQALGGKSIGPFSLELNEEVKKRERTG